MKFSQFMKNFKWSILLPLFLSSFLVQGQLSAKDYSDRSTDRILLYEIDSTQTFAKKCAIELLTQPGQWVIITADHLTNTIESAENLYITFMTLYPTAKANELTHLLQVSTLAFTRALKDFHFDGTEIKWPDALVLNEKKVADCVCETLPSPLEGYSYVFVGLALNVNMTPEQVALSAEPTTALSIESGKIFDREKLLNIIFYELDRYIDRFLEVNFHSAFYCEFDDCLAFKNRPVELELSSNSFVRGRFLGIDCNGWIVLETKQGKCWRIEHGRILRVLSDDEYLNSK